MLASEWSFYAPANETFVIGIGVGIAILMALFFTRSVLAGLLGGAISWGLIAVVVYGTGHGTMTDFAQVINGVKYGIAGAVAGLIAGLLGRVT